ncbi:hypothetical protein [Pseudomonas sp. NFACC49-2]|uniref:hypothetical protein n=1 Tax=Pseudomonas sp. NFACC49-2 TaxID=1566222 RepID=UPI0011606B91|nr:hypothetical protein [Pseudomonas sp. NFACC49-2]
MSRAFGHSSDPLIAISEIFRNICLDGTALTVMALAVLALSYGELKGLDSFVPLSLKIFRATTEKTDICRVKEKLARELSFILTPRK